jgi:hypothetical protein
MTMLSGLSILFPVMARLVRAIHVMPLPKPMVLMFLPD